MKDGSISVEQLSIYIVTAICLCHTITHFSNKYQNKFGLQNGSSMDPTIHNRNGDIISVQYTPLILAIKIFSWYIYVTLSRIETKHLNLIVAMNVHEVMIGSDLTIKKKNLPSDPFFKAVNIKES